MAGGVLHTDRGSQFRATREELRIAIVTWIERTYRRRRQAALRFLPFEIVRDPGLSLYRNGCPVGNAGYLRPDPAWSSALAWQRCPWCHSGRERRPPGTPGTPTAAGSEKRIPVRSSYRSHPRRGASGGLGNGSRVLGRGVARSNPPLTGGGAPSLGGLSVPRFVVIHQGPPSSAMNQQPNDQT